MNIRDQKAQAVKTTAQTWQSVSVGDTVVIYVREGRQEKGIVREIELQADGGYPILTIDTGAYGIFLKPADECDIQVTVALHINLPACEMPAEVAAELSRGVPLYYPVADWEVWREGEGPGAPPF